MLENFDLTSFSAMIIVIFVGLGLHEYAHAALADAAGDPTPRLHGRVTPNIFNHLDPMGSLMIIISSISGFGIGWGRPVPMDPSRMKNPRFDHFMAVAGGPLTNFIQAGIYTVLLKLALQFQWIHGPGFFFYILIFGVIINVGLGLFNLLPIGPLDGMWLVGDLLPAPIRMQWIRWNLTTGQFVFLGLLMLGWISPELSIFSHVLLPIREMIIKLLI